MITNSGTGDTTVTVALSTSALVRRWEDGPQIPDQVRRAVSDGIDQLAASSHQAPFATEYRDGIRLMLQFLIARFGFTRREALAVIDWYQLERDALIEHNSQS